MRRARRPRRSIDASLHSVQPEGCGARGRWLRCEQFAQLAKHRMPGTEIVRKQTVLGGAAGIALLAFALCYRFYPIHGHIVLRSPSPVEPTASPDATLRSAPLPQAPPPAVAP